LGFDEEFVEFWRGCRGKNIWEIEECEWGVAFFERPGLRGNGEDYGMIGE